MFGEIRKRRDALRIYMAGTAIFGIQIACQMMFNVLGNVAEPIVDVIAVTFTSILFLFRFRKILRVMK